MVSAAVDALAALWLADTAFRPDRFFVFESTWVVGSVLIAIVFCLAGSFMPAHRAASLDPAEVLSQP